MHQPSKDSYSQEIYSTTFHPAVSKLTDRVLRLVTQSCLILCDPMDCSPPGFSVHGILQARVLEWVAISFSKGSSQARDRTRVFCRKADPLPAEPPPFFLENLSTAAILQNTA